MIVYAESNFVLELALRQEQASSCERLLDMCQAGRIHLLLPAFSLVEPTTALINLHRRRREIALQFQNELTQLGRSIDFSHLLTEFASLQESIVLSIGADLGRLEAVQKELLKTAHVIPLTSLVLAAAKECEGKHDLSFPDAVVYASVLNHLTAAQPQMSCFLNRNSRDFDTPTINAELIGLGCTMISRFDRGLEFISAKISD